MPPESNGLTYDDFLELEPKKAAKRKKNKGQSNKNSTAPKAALYEQAKYKNDRPARSAVVTGGGGNALEGGSSAAGEKAGNDVTSTREARKNLRSAEQKPSAKMTTVAGPTSARTARKRTSLPKGKGEASEAPPLGSLEPVFLTSARLRAAKRKSMMSDVDIDVPGENRDECSGAFGKEDETVVSSPVKAEDVDICHETTAAEDASDKSTCDEETGDVEVGTVAETDILDEDVALGAKSSGDKTSAVSTSAASVTSIDEAPGSAPDPVVELEQDSKSALEPAPEEISTTNVHILLWWLR
ncbi:hypothetical protein MKZ38_009742 [Zalerion maritima]|uniref:Uncharacterized protein n=1 Tax=Zalerion maritima TaxID=339359 RepID=A0AAD5WUW7_9PEZI|nr:hypothetical protein MKZ38_009742 [Zalerion maritima]